MSSIIQIINDKGLEKRLENDLVKYSQNRAKEDLVIRFGAKISLDHVVISEDGAVISGKTSDGKFSFNMYKPFGHEAHVGTISLHYYEKMIEDFSEILKILKRYKYDVEIHSSGIEGKKGRVIKHLFSIYTTPKFESVPALTEITYVGKDFKEAEKIYEAIEQILDVKLEK